MRQKQTHNFPWMAECVKTEKAALAGPLSSVVSTAAVAVKFD